MEKHDPRCIFEDSTTQRNPGMLLSMATGRLRKLFKRIEGFEILRSFFDQWGITKLIASGAGIMIATLYAVWSWLDSHLPLWGIGLVFLGTLALFLVIANYGVDLYRKGKAEKLDHKKIGEGLVRLGDDMLGAFNEYVQTRQMHRAGLQMTDKTPHERWEDNIREDGDVTRFIAQKFGPRVSATVMILHKLDIKIPSHLTHISGREIPNLASYLGAVGNLIKEGNISAARGIDDHTAWMISGLFTS
jgi:hypothetical protein